MFGPAGLDMKAKAGYLLSCTENSDGDPLPETHLHSAEGSFQAAPVSGPSAGNHHTGVFGVQTDQLWSSEE